MRYRALMIQTAQCVVVFEAPEDATPEELEQAAADAATAEPLPDEQVAEIRDRADRLYRYSANHDGEDGDWDTLAGEDVPALLADRAALLAQLGDLGQERDKLIRWHAEDGRQLAKAANARRAALDDFAARLEQRALRMGATWLRADEIVAALRKPEAQPADATDGAS